MKLIDLSSSLGFEQETSIPLLKIILSILAAEIGAGGTAVIVIEPSDDAFGVINFTSSSFARSVMEGQTVDFELQRSGGTLGDILIGWEVENAGGDLSPRSGEVLMRIGERRARFSVVARNDLVCITTFMFMFICTVPFTVEYETPIH